VRGLCERLGIAADSLDDDMALSDKVVNVVTSMKTRLDALEERVGERDVDDQDDEDDTLDPEQASDDEDDDYADDEETDDSDLEDDEEETDDSDVEDDEEEPADDEEETGQQKSTKRPVLASLGNAVRKSRELTLSDLVRGGHITKAAKDELAKTWLSEEAIALSLSEDSAEAAGAGFEGLVAALKMNKAINMGERSGPQTMSLAMLDAAADGQQSKSSLSANAERRAEVQRQFMNGHHRT